MIEFNIDMGDGTRTLNSQELLQQLAEFSGFQPVGISQDGSSGIFQTPTGLQTIPFHEALQQVGAKIDTYKPLNAVPSDNIVKYRMALDSISDPDIQDAYLRTIATKDFNVKDPLIVGSGIDRYLWDQNSGKWVALTNAQGLDLSDIVAGGAGLAKGGLAVGGALLGGAGGSFAAPIAGTIAGAGAGAAAGNALGDVTQAGIMSALDPSFREAYGSAGNYFGKEGTSIAKNAAISGALGAAIPGAGALLRGASAPLKTVVSPISQGMQAAGTGISNVGKMGRAIGKSLESDIGRFGMQVGLDPTGVSGIGAFGGFVKDVAPNVAQGAVKAGDIARKGIANIRGLEGPIRSFAGETWEQTAKNLPNVGNFVRGVESLGRGLESAGRGMENVIAGTAKGVGSALDYGGKGLNLAGRAGQYVEPAAYQAGLRNALDPIPQATMIPGQGSGPANYIPIQQRDLISPPRTNQSLFDAIRASGGLEKFF